VTLRARRGASRWLEDVIDTPVLASGTEIVDPDPAWRTLRLTLDWPREVAGRLLALGGAVEVLEPPELRAEIAALAAEAAAVYATSATTAEAGTAPG
jgi:predicted DNA-binding transcriptional regulator YafY